MSRCPYTGLEMSMEGGYDERNFVQIKTFPAALSLSKNMNSKMLPFEVRDERGFLVANFADGHIAEFFIHIKPFILNGLNGVPPEYRWMFALKDLPEDHRVTI